MADLLNTSLAKSQVKTSVTNKKSTAKTSTASTTKTAATTSTTKMTSTQVQSGIADGTLSATKAVSALQSDLNAKVTKTTSGSKTTAQTTVGGKSITINTNDKNAAATTTAKNTTSAAKSAIKDLTTTYNECKALFKNISEKEFKPLYDLIKQLANNSVPDENTLKDALNVLSKMNTAQANSAGTNTSTRNNAPAKAPSSDGGGDGSDGGGNGPTGPGGNGPTGPGGNGPTGPGGSEPTPTMTQIYQYMADLPAVNFTQSGGITIGAAQAWETAIDLISTWYNNAFNGWGGYDDHFEDHSIVDETSSADGKGSTSCKDGIVMRQQFQVT